MVNFFFQIVHSSFYLSLSHLRESDTEEFTMFEVKVKTLDGTNSSFDVEDDVSKSHLLIPVFLELESGRNATTLVKYYFKYTTNKCLVLFLTINILARHTGRRLLNFKPC